MRNAFIVDGVRTAVGKFGGALARVRADDLAAHVLTAVLERQPEVPAAAIDDVIFGCANQAGEDNRNVARMATLLAGLPETVPGETVNRLCASGLSAVVNAARAIQLGDGDLLLAGGVEHMTRAPFVMAKNAEPFGRQVEVYDTSFGWRFENSKLKARWGTDSMGQTAENLAEKFKISRLEQDEFAARSQALAETARKSGRLAKEIIAISIPQRKGEPLVFDSDEFPRPGTSVAVLGKLGAAFRKDGKGSVTAGNTSGINDGACALLLAGQSAVDEFKLNARARIVASAVVGVEPRIMGIGPVAATRKVLQKAGLTLADINVIELNEAFAVQVLACLKELGLQPNDNRLNPNGGAIALGHPLGMTGARLVLTALHELEERQERYALITLCVGVGQGMACIIERV